MLIGWEIRRRGKKRKRTKKKNSGMGKSLVGWRSGAMPLREKRDVAEETDRTGGRTEIRTDQTRAFALKSARAPEPKT